MADIIDLAALKQLPADDRLALIEELWDSLTPADDLPLHDWQREELDRRLDAFERGTSIGAPWNVVRARLRHPS
jgi:putative addiction module component (TIGR02574 family)